MKKSILDLGCIALFIGSSLFAGSLSDEIIETKHNKELTLGELAEIQPGLGTVMIEFGHRYYISYYAANARNWDLAKYELEELIEAQEIAEATRPKYAKDLKNFEDGALAKLIEAIDAKNWTLFEKRYEETTKACNACHRANGHGYIHYQLPKTAPKYLKMELSK